ncbi:MAG: ATP-binding protein [Candidatus Saccharimonadales bacterium]|nr:ATP-binding protein [Candidatus Saccharibacteria bacterium]
MGKLQPTKPLLILLYGMPGSGKTFFARQLCEQITAAHVQGDRIRDELFEKPTYSKEENHIVASLMAYMTSEFLSAGISVIFDTNAMRLNQRRALRNLAIKARAQTVLLWIQIDPDSAFKRASKRDKRKQDDHYAQDMDPATFRELLGGMQNPDLTENYLVLSGKHVFSTQKNAVIRYLAEKRLIDLDSTAQQISKPGLINIVPNPAAGRVDLSRRNINIH